MRHTGAKTKSKPFYKIYLDPAILLDHRLLSWVALWANFLLWAPWTPRITNQQQPASSVTTHAMTSSCHNNVCCCQGFDIWCRPTQEVPSPGADMTVNAIMITLNTWHCQDYNDIISDDLGLSRHWRASLWCLLLRSGPEWWVPPGWMLKYVSQVVY